MIHRRSLLLRLAGLSLGSPMLLAGSAAAAEQASPTPVAGRDWFVFLETGVPTPPDKERVMAMQKGHIDNFGRLFAAGKLFAAGPMRDPAKVKRGIVVVRAPDPVSLRRYFDEDEYVALGHMTLNAQPCTVRKALNTTGLNLQKIVENRIVMLTRTPAFSDADQRPLQERLAALVAAGTFGAWYEMEAGPIHHILFRVGTDDAPLNEALSSLPGRAAGSLQAEVWGQWFAEGVVR